MRFCQGLFGLLHADLATVRREIRDSFEIRETAESVVLPWSLVYAVGTRV